MQLSRSDIVRLPSGAFLDPARPRSRGVLEPEALAWCRENAVALGYDPVQGGWLPLTAEDDLDADDAGWPAPRRRAADGLEASLRFRPWSAADLPAYRALLDDPEVWRFMPERYPAPLTEDLARDLIALSSVDGRHEVRCVERAGRPVGQVRLLFDAQGQDRSGAEISYWLGRAHWGAGIGGAMVRAAGARAFRDHPGLRRLVARVHPANAGSARLLSRAGYRRDPGVGPDGWLMFRRDRPDG